jgi:hypothetical protein
MEAKALVGLQEEHERSFVWNRKAFEEPEIAGPGDRRLDRRPERLCLGGFSLLVAGFLGTARQEQR